ncbi:MAG: hypothetical protein GY913_23270 [Proteobacteria bacterium]|nr:hypothetical protein [Pseudomonadota bacterium]MCP4919833.1 hypothetical protein [Pseudomonadota bacterium]
MTLLAILACATDAEDDTLYAGPAEGKILGVVTDSHGEALVDVQVTLPDGTQVLTDGHGVYRFDPLDPGDMVVSYDLPGYSKKFRTVHIEGWERVTANVELVEVGAIFDFDPAVGGVFEHSSVRLDIPAGDLVDSLGQPYNGPATLELTGYDPLDYSADTTGIPGPGTYNGLPSDGSDGFMGTAGFFEATLRSPDGEYLNLGPDTPASVELDDPRQVLAEDDSYENALMEGDPALWWFDPDLGTWVEEGVFATTEDEEGNAILNAEVDHFSWWNADFWFYDSMSCEGGQVLDSAGNPVVGATVTLAADYVWRGYYDDFYYSPHSLSTTTDSSGGWSIYPVGALNPYYVMTVEYTLPNGEVVVDIQSITTGEHSQDEYNDWDWNGTCNVIPPVVIDTCVLAGDIRVAWNVNEATSAASAWYFEAGEGDCDSAGTAFDVEIGEWAEVDTSVTPANVTPDFTELGLESTLRSKKTKIKDGGNTMVVMTESNDGGIYYTSGYQTSAVDAFSSESSYTFWAKGIAGGIAGYTQADAVVTPPALENLDVGTSTTEVDITWDAESYDGGVYVMVTGADTAVIFRTEDTGAFTWGDEAAALFGGEEGLSLVVWRTAETEHDMTSGNAVRALVTGYVTDSLTSGPDCVGVM